MAETFTPPDANGNPLVSLAIAVIYAFLYVLDWIRTLVTWLTITVPGIIVRMLQYSLTISLGFPTLFGLTLASLVGLTFLVRYRYLARYTQLKESALPPPSPPTLSTELLPLSTPGLGDRRNRSAAFHNYLDDFLAAIRIFGYLEKPVFHELSRHLQTRRLAAGESIEIGGGEFWCVVEGKVQVFAPSDDDVSGTPSAFENTGSFNGYHLLNEVSTGGTLSSLFSILHLFTEDIKIAWTPRPGSAGPEEIPDGDDDADLSVMTENGGGSTPNGEASGDEEEDAEHLEMRRRSRQDSDVSQMEGQMGRRLASPTASPSPSSRLGHTRSMSAGSSTIADDSATSPPPATVSAVSASVPGTKTASPNLNPVHINEPSPSRANFRSHSQKGIRGSSAIRDTPDDTPRTKSSASGNRPHRGPAAKNQNAADMKGTIARATVDTTLAVIPSEAFRKLTKKFPKASGTVVQVVLERFTRVTFMTAHKFLGLTREILRSESSLNSLVSHPLPPEFYTGGGMQALRARFQPQRQPSPSHRQPSEGSATTFPRVTTRDYFNYSPASPTVKAPSLPSFTPIKAMTPAALTESPTQAPTSLPKIDTDVEDSEAHVPGVPESADIGWSPETAKRHNTKFLRQTSAMRKQVAAGDLAMSQYADEESNGAYYRKSMQTPGLPRQDTWRGRLSGSTTELGSHGVPLDSTGSIEEELEIRDAVMICIAKSIGLIQPTETNLESVAQSLAPSVGAASPSPPASPMFPPNSVNGRLRNSRSPFGNVLDMMNASTNTDNMVSGMLREAVLASARTEEEASVFSASLHESGLLGQDINRKLVKDLEGCVEILFFKKGSMLVKEGAKSPGIYYVIDGFLDVALPIDNAAGNDPHQHTSSNPFSANDTSPEGGDIKGRPFGAAFGLGSGGQNRRKEDHKDEILFTVQPGGLAGYLASLCSTDSYVNIKAKTDCYVGFLPTRDLERILERRPIVLLTLAKRLLSLLSPLVLHIDAGLDWMQLSAGQVLYEKGDRSNDIYIIINGRLRSLDEQENGVKVLREYGQSDTIGELDVITAVARSDTVHAIRDSELVRIPAALFDAISVKHPATTVQFMRLIAGRVKQAMREQSTKALDGGLERIVSDVNLKTVCILGTNRNVPVSHFAGKLKTSLEDLGATTSYLDQGTVMRHLGRHAFARIGQLKIAGWLADQEQHYRTVLYVADTPPSSQWTLTCIRQADLVLVLAMGDDPVIGEYEKLLLATKTTARKELILLHDERAVASGSTRPWLRNRPWLHAHHHVELPGVVTPVRANPPLHDPAAIAAFKHLREQVETRIKKYRGLRPLRPRRPPHMSDFARIARRLCGKQIGVVLGGGGGRGISHIGMLQALEEYGIPVDAISGCSIGAFVGGLYARGTDILETTGRTKQFSGRMGSVLRILSDVTYPFVAYTTGHEFNRGIYKAFYNTHIEDFWLPFFANSTNITHSRMEIHRAGYAWRYVRASMTLAGLLPPLSDNGNLLVDGGYMDNTPIGPLRANGIRDIFVVDVGSVDDTSPRNYGDSVSGWWIFLNKFNPFYKRDVLSMTEVSSRLVYVSSVKVLDDVKKDPHCLYLAMPVQQFETLGGFKKFQEVLAVGLDAGREALRGWKEEGRLPTGLEDEVKGAATVQRGTRLRRMSI